MAALLTALAGTAAADGPDYHPVYTPDEPPVPSQSDPTPAVAPAIVAPAAAPPRNGFRIRRVRRLRGNGRAIVFVRIFAPGRTIVRGPRIQTAVRGARRPGIVRVPVKPKGRLHRYLRRRGKARIRIRITFRPFGGVPVTRRLSLALRKRR